MGPDAHIRVEGTAGRITIDRPKALNALTHQICRDTMAALDTWAADPKVRLVILDGAGERAFCAGGDIAFMHASGSAGDFSAGRDFWRDEYRMNARLSAYPKPVVSFLHGFVMGGGVGFGCHASHRVVCASTRVSMPECGIGLVPDVGGTYLLSRAPGRLGMHLGLTGARMGPGDALHAGFADHFIAQSGWPALVENLVRTGDATLVAQAAAAGDQAVPASDLAALAPELDAAYNAPGRGASYVAQVLARLATVGHEWAETARGALERNSPLSLACAAEMIAALGPDDGIRAALRQEYRWTWRSMDRGDFLEGIRAQIIDKDRTPSWRHAAIDQVTDEEVAAMLAPLGANELTFEEGNT